MDYRLLMDTSILAGEIIMEKGGEAYRAEETVNRMLNTSNAKHVEVVVMGTSMVATVSNPYRDAITATRRIRRRGTNLHRIAQVNDISREMCDGKLSLEECTETLKRETRRYAKRQLTWFKKDSRIEHISAPKDIKYDKILKFAEKLVKKYSFL